jgi:hypothetical protein
MKRILFLLVVFLALPIQLVRGAEMPAVIDRPGADDGPTQISTAIWIVDVTSIDSAQ